MARKMTVLSVFVASPSDVEEERSRLERVTRDLNLEWARTIGVSLELVKWESHTYPGFGEDAQTVISEQIRNDYDVFLGIMWCRAGTTTKSAESGTIEEYRRAKKRHDDDPRSVHLMFYFKDAPIAPSKIDAIQMNTVAEFRASLGDEGLYYWKFDTAEDFEKQVRRHLTLYVQDWRRKNLDNDEQSGEEPSSASGVQAAPNDATEQEVGLLDLADGIEDAFSELAEVSEHIAEATAEVAEMINQRTGEVQRINQRRGQNINRRKLLRASLANAAGDMNKYVSRIEHLLPSFASHLDEGMMLFTEAIPLIVQMSDGSDDSRSTHMKDGVKTLKTSLTISIDQLEAFKSAVKALPSMTATLNQSRRSTEKVIQRQIDAMRRANIQLTEVERLIDSSLSQ